MWVWFNHLQEVRNRVALPFSLKKKFHLGTAQAWEFQIALLIATLHSRHHAHPLRHMTKGSSLQFTLSITKISDIMPRLHNYANQFFAISLIYIILLVRFTGQTLITISWFYICKILHLKSFVLSQLILYQSPHTDRNPREREYSSNLALCNFHYP